MRGSAFHSSSSVRSRLAPARQSLPSAIFSASATSFSLDTLASAVFCTRSARRDSRCPSITGRSASSRVVREARSPTALASVTCAETVFTDWSASSGDITPERIRCSSSSTSNDSASNRSVKNASASSGVPAGYCPTARSPSAVRTKTFPSSSTRPHSCTDPWLITAAW